jgi:TolB-like protein/Tfp pilus assembly protein PilF
VEERLPRRLAAILYADVAGYSRLTGEDEDSTHHRLSEYLDLISSTVDQHRGRVMHYAGDAVLAMFEAVFDAVSGAVAIQNELQTRNQDLPDERKVQFRIGVNLGDVIEDRGDIYGDGVNVAARLESLADPGGICISESVRTAVAKKFDLGFEFMGEQEVKNIAEPVRVYRALLASPEAFGAPLPLPDKPSIAVLPFNNLSGDPEQEFFADGMAEDIITALSRYRWFFVIARNSTFTYKGRAVDVKQVAKELGVRYVLEGSVRRSGDRIRVTGQLIDAETGSHIWAERFDRNIADIFAVQDEITEQIVSAIEPELGAAERERARRKPPESLDAWDLFQRGLWHVHHMNKHDHSEAKRLMQDVVEIDPDFSPAYAYLAFLHYIAALHGFEEDNAKMLAEGRALGDKAVTLDRNDSVAHFALARILTMQGDTSTAIAESKTAISLNPNCSHSHHSLGWALYWGNADAETALVHFDTALRLNPRDPLRWITLMMKGASLRLLKRYDEAIEWGRAACQYSEANFLPPLHLAATCGQAGRMVEARAATTKALELRPELTITFMRKRYATLHSAMGEPFFDGLRKAGLPE